MSALADDVGWPYTYGDLDAAGVTLSEGQQRLYLDCQHRPRKALTVGFVQDFTEPRLPVIADCMDPDGQRGKWHFPMVVDLRPEHWVEVGEDPVWWRYPTVPGRTYTVGPLSDQRLNNVEGFRLWMLEPITVSDADLLFDLQVHYEREVLLPREMLAGCDRGDIDTCDAYSEATGTPFEHHRHAGNLEGFWLCEDSEDWLQAKREEFVRLDDDGMTVWLPLPRMSALPDDLAALYDNLVESSQEVSWRLHNALPRWEQDKVLRTERHYSPWLS